MEVDSHIGVAVAGLIGGYHIFIFIRDAFPKSTLYFILDARTLVEHARIEAQNHKFTFDEVSVYSCSCSSLIGLTTLI